MRLYFDLEFTGLHQKTTPISIGIVSDEEHSFYWEFTDYDKTQVDAWIEENVIANLDFVNFHETEHIGLKSVYASGTRFECSELLIEWLLQFKDVTFYGDCLAYDWVLLNELWGGALRKPENVYYIPTELCTALDYCGVDPDINRETFCEVQGAEYKHNALHDAEIIRLCFERLGIHILELEKIIY